MAHMVVFACNWPVWNAALIDKTPQNPEAIFRFSSTSAQPCSSSHLPCPFINVGLPKSGWKVILIVCGWWLRFSSTYWSLRKFWTGPSEGCWSGAWYLLRIMPAMECFERFLPLYPYDSVQDFAVLAGVVEVESQELQKAIRSLQDQIEVCARCSEYLWCSAFWCWQGRLNFFCKDIELWYLYVSLPSLARIIEFEKQELQELVRYRDGRHFLDRIRIR